MSTCSMSSFSGSVRSSVSRGSDSGRSPLGRSSLHWKKFRKNVLTPHNICIFEKVSSEKLPQFILGWLDDHRSNTHRFAMQRQAFRRQVQKGLGFSSSALFPPDILPSIERQPFLARCMVPSFSQEAVPDAAIEAVKSATKLSVPRPGLGCGFATAAFNAKELSNLPSWLTATGTSVVFNTGSISSGSALYCPFLTFERTFSQHDYHLEVTSNQCAVGGAWCIRSLQMLYAKASSEHVYEQFDKPVSFSCCIDNQVAVINYHWLGDDQAYCMAPIIRFNMTRDDHFDQFMVWVEAIEQWAITCLLPNIKKAVSIVGTPSTALSLTKPSLRKLDTNKGRIDKGLLSALRMTYEDVAWDFDNESTISLNEPESAVSSSTASCGSPMITRVAFPNTFPKLEYPAVGKASNLYGDFNLGRVRFADPLIKDVLVKANPWPKPPLPNPETSENAELVLRRRLGHAMDEIRDLQGQIQTLKHEMDGSRSSLQNEVEVLRNTMSSVILKEKLTGQGAHKKGPRSSITVETEHRLDISQSVVTTPTEPKPNPFKTGAMPRRPSNLSHVLSIDTTSTTSTIKTRYQTPISQRQDDDDDDDEETWKTPMTTHLPVIIFPTTNRVANVQEGGKVEEIENFQDVEELPTVDTSASTSTSKLLSNVVAGHLLSAFVPSSMFKIVVLGALMDYAMSSMNAAPTASVSGYFQTVFDNSNAF